MFTGLWAAGPWLMERQAPSRRLGSGMLHMSVTLPGPVATQGAWSVPGDSFQDPDWRSSGYSGHVLIMPKRAGFTGQAYSKLRLSDSQTSYWPKQVPNQMQSQKAGKYSLSTRVWMENSITGAQRLEPMISLLPPLQLPAATLAAALADRDTPPGPLCPQPAPPNLAATRVMFLTSLLQCLSLLW